MTALARVACIVSIAAASHGCARESSRVLMLKTNGGWCWFQDPRALVDGDQLIFGSVAGSIVADSKAGDIDVTSVDLESGASTSFTLAPEFQRDDHDVPALLKLPDGRYLAAYQRHGNDSLTRWRITRRPGDVTDWHDEQTADAGAGVTYANLFQLPSEGGRIYNFHRGIAFNPNYMISDDGGRSFGYGGRLMSWQHPQQTRGGGRPYVRYVSNDADTIHFIATEDHPLHYDNSIYHGFYRKGLLHRSDGTEVAPISADRESAVMPTDFTRVFAGGPGRIAWTSDIQLDERGHPHITFSVERDSRERGDDLRYWHGRWDGAKWHTREIAHAGTRLYAREVDYTGLATLDPDDLSTVVISTNAHPETGRPLNSRADGKRHWEIYRGETLDGGRTWRWTAITENSTCDNIRPIIPRSPRWRVVLWLRGTYRSYTDYDLDVVGTIEPAKRT